MGKVYKLTILRFIQKIINERFKKKNYPKSNNFNSLKLKLITTLFIFLPLLAFPQYYATIKVPINFKGAPLNIDSLSYQIIQIEDNRADKSLLGTGFYGVANHFVRYEIRSGIPYNFTKFFKKVVKKKKAGSQSVLIEFKRISMFEKITNLGVKGGRRRNYEIEVNYYLLHEDNRLLVLNSRKRIDSTTKVSRYFISEFCSDFFRKSMLDLNDSLKSFDLEKALTKINKDSLILVNQINKDTIEFKLKANGDFIFRDKNLDSEIKQAIQSKYINSVKGNYTVEYVDKENMSNQNPAPITTLKYKKSAISPFLYITLPALIILGLISGASSG